MRKSTFILMAILLAGLASRGFADPNLRAIETRHYIIQTDMPDDFARECVIRLDRMFEEYTIRTAEFGREIKDKFPVFIYAREADYLAAGGIPKSGGSYRYVGSYVRLLINVNNNREHALKIIQHEGFHQFAILRIGTLPVWVNEGLADYFQEAIFTGDSFVRGNVPPQRLQEVQQMIAARQYTPFAKFFALTDQEWSDSMAHSNYSQAWSIVHFLVHGDPKYQTALTDYLKKRFRGVFPQTALDESFGKDLAPFEAAWKKYWTSLNGEVSRPLLFQAKVLTFTSFIARARASGTQFPSMAAFFEKAQAGSIKLAPDPARWLPPQLLTEALQDKDKDKDILKWDLKWTAGRPEVTAVREDGSTATARYRIANGFDRTVCDFTPGETAPSTNSVAATKPAVAAAMSRDQALAKARTIWGEPADVWIGGEEGPPVMVGGRIHRTVPKAFYVGFTVQADMEGKKIYRNPTGYGNSWEAAFADAKRRDETGNLIKN